MKSSVKYFVFASALAMAAAGFVLLPAKASTDNQPANLQDSFNKIKESVQEVKDSTKDLIDTKESDTLTQTEKDQQELSQRLDIFKKVLELSKQEATDTTNQLKALSNLNDKSSALRDQFIAEFGQYLNFYDEQNQILAKPEEIDLAKIKDLAQSFKDWRDTTYMPELNAATDFLLISQQKLAVEMAENRFNKISSDVNKLKKAGLKGVDKLTKSLGLAANSIKSAKSLRQQAEDKFWAIENEISATSTPSTVNDSSTLDIAPEINKVSSSTIPTISNASSTISLTPEDQFLSIKGLVGDSLNKIKGTYQIFIEMSNFVKKLLI